jgi:mitotic spindle assembly checkpoint protein MAD1
MESLAPKLLELIRSMQQQNIALMSGRGSSGASPSGDYAQKVLALTTEVKRLEEELHVQTTAADENKARLLKTKRFLVHMKKQRNGLQKILDSYDEDEDSFTDCTAQRLERIKQLEVAVETSDTMVKAAEDEAAAVRAENAQLGKQLSLLDKDNLELQQRLGSGEYNQVTTKVFHATDNPERAAHLARISALVARLSEYEAKAVCQPRQPASAEQTKQLKEALAKVADNDKMILRLKEVFFSKIAAFREACYQLTGFKVTVKQQNQYRLRSMYAEREGDDLLFQQLPSGAFKVMETAYVKTLDKQVVQVLKKFNSIPMFLSHITLDLFERQTTM